MNASKLLSAAEVGTYLGAVDWLIDVVGRPEIAAAWDAPSALAQYTTGGVASHAVHGVIRLLQLLGEDEPPVGRVVTVAEYFGPHRVDDPARDDPLFVQLRAGAEDVARRGPHRLVARCGAARAELAVLLPMTREDRATPVVRIPGGTTTAADYLRTRVLESVVHGDDLVASVDGFMVPDPPLATVEVCLGLCLELARARLGDRQTLRTFTRAERSSPDPLRVL